MEVVSNSLKKIKIKFSLFFVLFVAALFSFVVAASRQQLRQATSITVSIAGMPVLQKIAAFIDGDKYERLAQTLDETDPFYIETQEKIRAIRSNTHCLYLYTMAPYTHDVHRFIFDSEPPDSENFSPLGAEEDISDYIIDYRRTYENKTPQSTPLMFQSKWGRLISAYMPILNSKGDAVGIIGIDFEGQKIYDAIFINAARQIGFSLVFVVIGMFIYFYLLKDLTGQNEELLKMSQQAQAASSAKSDFLARMSHEIRTPMNAVLGMSELALRDYGSPKCLEYIQGIKSAGQSLLTIINDILDFSKIESGRLELVSSPYETSSLLNDALTMIRIRMAEKPIELIVEADPDIPCVMTGDFGRIKQVLLNLLSNAVKYTVEGSIKFSFSGQAIGSDAILLTFVVADSGIGIKSEDMPKLFGEFARVDEKRNISIEGTGLGLSIARNLCRAMDGDITVKSEYGKGSTFTATLIQSVSDWKPAGDMTVAAALTTVTQQASSTAPEIEGVDIAAGMAMVGWQPGRYRKLLHIFSKDAEAGFALLESIPDDSSLPSFTTFVHALKSGLANIGAKTLSQSAAMLESAGRSGDMAAIRDGLAPFREKLAALMERIDEITVAVQSGQTSDENASEEQLREAATEFKDALEARDMDGVEAALARLQALSLAPKFREAVADVAKHVLFGDFKRAAQALSSLFESGG